MISEAMELIGHVAIRNRGTIGGSLAHADPAAECATFTLLLDAELELLGPAGPRTVAARDFFVGYYTTAVAPDELLTQIRLRIPHGRAGSCFVEVSRRHGDFALVGVGALISLADDETVADARIALIGVGDRPVRPTVAEALLRGRVPSEAVIDEATAALDDEIHPTGDIHASESYRRDVAGVLLRRALATAITRARGGDEDGRT
jgi:carbon-monoxide dehydrogenase medium subunit